MAVPVEWVEYAKALGLPAFFGVGAYYVLPKIWNYIQARGAISIQQTDLTQVGLAGVQDVVITMRNQLADMNDQLDGFRARLKDMETTLQKAIDDKLSAEQGEAIAKNELFNASLYIKKLIAQLKSLGIPPVDP